MARRRAIEDTVRATEGDAVVAGATTGGMVAHGGIREARGTSGVTVRLGILVDATAIAVSSVPIQLCLCCSTKTKTFPKEPSKFLAALIKLKLLLNSELPRRRRRPTQSSL